MREIIVEASGNFCGTEYGVNPDSPSDYSGAVTKWNCGCVTATGGYRKLCGEHRELPPVLRRMQEPVTVSASNHGTTWAGEKATLICDTEHLRKLRRRVEDALRKGGDGQVLRCAEILGVRID